MQLMPSVIWHCWLGGRKGIRPEKQSNEVLAWLSVWSEVQMICIWCSWCHCHPIISCTSKIQNGLPFWCRLTQVILEKRQLNRCIVVVVVLSSNQDNEETSSFFSLFRNKGLMAVFAVSTERGSCQLWQCLLCWNCVLLFCQNTFHYSGHHQFAVWTFRPCNRMWSGLFFIFVLMFGQLLHYSHRVLPLKTCYQQNCRGSTGI